MRFGRMSVNANFSKKTKFFGHFLRAFWRKRSDDFIETRLLAQRIPLRLELEKSIAKGVRNALHRSDLLDGKIPFPSPGVNLR
jgi:hypothetical protein